MPEKEAYEGLPSSVRDAQALDFGLPITAYLCCARADFPFVIGVVFGDSKTRFRQGATIRTSPIENAFEMHGLWVCETINDSRYVVCDWTSETHPPIRTGHLH